MDGGVVGEFAGGQGREGGSAEGGRGGGEEGGEGSMQDTISQESLALLGPRVTKRTLSLTCAEVRIMGGSEREREKERGWKSKTERKRARER